MSCRGVYHDQESVTAICRGGYGRILLAHRDGPTDRLHQLFLQPGVYVHLLHLIADGRVAYTAPIFVNADDPPPNAVNVTGDTITLLGLNLNDGTGHYVGAYITDKHVEIHDSMSTADGDGFLIPQFIRLAQACFPERIISVAPVRKGERALQPTGGFQQVRSPLLPANAEPLLHFYNIDAQDYLCFCWALLQLHAVVLRYDLAVLRKRLAQSQLAPLLVIKVYAWLLLEQLDLLTAYPRELVPDYFAIWDAENRLRVADYRRYTFRLPVTRPRSINECFHQAVAVTKASVELQRQEELISPDSKCWSDDWC